MTRGFISQSEKKSFPVGRLETSDRTPAGRVVARVTKINPPESEGTRPEWTPPSSFHECNIALILVSDRLIVIDP